ncbi:flavin reductase family protein [Actinomadura sp. 3N407]|uniref:flavin reductase family protein n=1 Tax=Actinomadura sp. 3N407 TaxID=3457423 RepID=UPI003FCD0580
MAKSQIEPRDGLLGAHRADPDPTEFRRVLGHFATGVAAVTGIDVDGPAGLLVNSFTSVSLDPPLVAFCVGRDSVSWPRLNAGRRLCVCFLAADQRDLARRLAVSGAAKFHGVSWSPSPSGLPVVDGVLAWLECAVEAEYTAGDHVIVVSRVNLLSWPDDKARAGPLVFYRSGFGRFVAE